MHRITIRWYHSIRHYKHVMRPCTDKRTGIQKLATTGKATYYRMITNNQQQKTRSTNQQSAVRERSGDVKFSHKSSKWTPMSRSRFRLRWIRFAEAKPLSSMRIGLDAPLKRGNSSTLELTTDLEEFSVTSPVWPKTVRLETIDRVWQDNLGESASRNPSVEIRPVGIGQ